MKVTSVEGKNCTVELASVDVVALCTLVALGIVSAKTRGGQEGQAARDNLIERGIGYIKTFRDAFGEAAGVEQEQGEPQEVSSDE